MKAYFSVFDMVGVMELSAENIERAEDIVADKSEFYCVYELGISWDEDRKMPYIYAAGPWE
ncbi:MAG: hypothetical protein II453_19545 [Alphaproteobacteria bacterium]|nr:hypothetical protein [Alphaproteobacteria bacterium]